MFFQIMTVSVIVTISKPPVILEYHWPWALLDWWYLPHNFDIHSGLSSHQQDSWPYGWTPPTGEQAVLEQEQKLKTVQSILQRTDHQISVVTQWWTNLMRGALTERKFKRLWTLIHCDWHIFWITWWIAQVVLPWLVHSHEWQWGRCLTWGCRDNCGSPVTWWQLHLQREPNHEQCFFLLNCNTVNPK